MMWGLRFIVGLVFFFASEAKAASGGVIESWLMQVGKRIIPCPKSFPRSHEQLPVDCCEIKINNTELLLCGLFWCLKYIN